MNSKCKESLDISMGEENGFLPLPVGFMTKAIHAAQDPEQWSSMSVIPPITMSSTFKQTCPGGFEKYEYGRTGNPTRNLLEECLASLDGGKHSLAFASGLGAVTAVLSLMNAGDHMISCDDVYGGTHRLFTGVIARNYIEISYVDTTDVKNIEAAIRPNTRMLWIETPTNPLLRVSDIREISDICKQHDIILTVDNSFLTPYFQRPLELGADISMYSLSKYMNGHTDVIMGAVVVNDDALNTKLRFAQNSMGIVPSPFDCSQMLRSLKTLGVRMRQHSLNGVAVAKYLESHPKVTKVIHPGFPSHPHYERFKKQCSGHSAMIFCYIKGGLAETSTFLNALKLFATAGSLGGIQSLIESPVLISHRDVPKEQRESLGITDNSIRISVGLEDAEDLIADLEQALSLI